MSEKGGHAIIINTSNWMPFIFQFNPESIETKKKISYATAPNIGGSSKKKYFSGFDAKEISFTIKCVDKESATGVMGEISYFEQLREPDPGLLGIANSFWGNENYPPPQVLFQFGVSFIPLFWDVISVNITEDHFHSGMVRGMLGFPKVCEVEISLSLDEDGIFNKANQVAKKAAVIAATAKSTVRETKTLLGRGSTRREIPPYKIPIPPKW
ncbi:MAG: hypothetical protein GY853_01885 [PVC group bacterium]|nr:hypothetical protein [PVC group bacterium]